MTEQTFARTVAEAFAVNMVKAHGGEAGDAPLVSDLEAGEIMTGPGCYSRSTRRVGTCGYPCRRCRND